jgi:hypothetical protein
VRHVGVVERELNREVALTQRLRERHAGNVGQPAAADALDARILLADAGHILAPRQAQYLGGGNAPGVPARLGQRQVMSMYHGCALVPSAGVDRHQGASALES